MFDAVGNQCIRDVMEPGNTTPGVLDTDGDDCGDLSTTALTHTAVFPNIPCTDADNNGFVDPFTICQSWGNNDDQIGVNGCDISDVQVGTNPKCDCTSFDPGIPIPICGDGVINQKTEECDDGNQVGGDGCSATCQLEVCGDGVLTGGEQCDDGNTTACDGCSATCDVEACGNDVLECNEACDDGNQVDNDFCGNDCQVPVCGDGDVEGNEECDPGVSGGGGGCCDVQTCQLIGCGDGVVNCSETCDDGNQSNTDNCTNSCVPASCGDGFIQVGVEQCDDQNQVDTDFCDNACQLPVCGNGEVEGSEKCDDGNVIDGDGCASDCGIEVPTMGEYGLGALALLLIGAGFVVVRKGNLI